MPARPHPDRLLPVDPATRKVARQLYELVADAPIISPHGHVSAEMLASDAPFTNAADLFVTHDHYVTRLLHAAGVGLDELGVGASGSDADPREVWRLFASHWHLFAGTASGYWITDELSLLLGIDEELRAETADEIYSRISETLALPEWRPRALFNRFGIKVLATTDDPLDDLSAHVALRGALPGRVLPTFRPDAYIDPAHPSFARNVDSLLAVTDAPQTFSGYLDALAQRRQHFIRHGAVSADHGVEEPLAISLEASEAEALFARVRTGAVSHGDARSFRAHMLLQMARMSVEDGLVMTVHAGVVRNHSASTFERFGPDTGHDIPRSTDFVQGLHPLLESYGLERDFHLVLFAVDETTYSREIAPLAGFYPSVFIGAPWWFLDAPDAIGRFRSAVTETAGFSRGSGFIDDTRAFLSIPARHDTARRADAAFLARLVGEGRVSADSAEQIIQDAVDAQPCLAFKL